ERVLLEAKKILNDAYEQDLYNLAIQWKEKTDIARLKSEVEFNKKRRAIISPAIIRSQNEDEIFRNTNALPYGNGKGAIKGRESFYDRNPELKPYTDEEKAQQIQEKLRGATDILNNSIGAGFQSINNDINEATQSMGGFVNTFIM